MYLNIGTPYNHHFPYGINGKVVVFGVPILKHYDSESVNDSDDMFSKCYFGENIILKL